MSEGVGSTTIIVIIMLFITVVSAYMAYNVNYTKAFRMKNKIISLYEQYDGVCTGTCKSELAKYGKEIGYDGANINCEENPFKPDDSGVTTQKVSLNYQGTSSQYCEYKVIGNTGSNDTSVVDGNRETFYYRIVTNIDIQIPIVENIFSLRILNVTGDTKLFQKK